MLAGKIVKEFEDKKAVIRYPKMTDAEDLMELMNSLVEEGEKITKQSKIDIEEEIDWITDSLKKIEEEEAVYLVIEAGGRIIASAGITENKKDAESHTGSLGILLKKGFRSQGLGSKLMNSLLSESKKRLGVEILTLDVFESNTKALNFYKKFGFEEVERIKNGFKKNKGYEDKIIMKKDLENL